MGRRSGGGSLCMRLVLAGALALVGAVARADRSIEIESFDAAIVVGKSAEVDVTETIRFRFDGQWNGVHRRIPVVYSAGTGGAYALRFSLLGVADETGRPLVVERSRQRHEESLKIFVPGAVDALRTVVIRYRVRRAVKFFPDHDEFYWNVTGDEWPYPIGAARAGIDLPAEVENVRVNAFAGAFGAIDKSVGIRIDGADTAPEDTFAPAGESAPPADGGHRVEVRATRALGIREGLTVAVAWNPGGVRRPTAWEAAWDRFVDNSGAILLALTAFGLPVVAALSLFGRWLRVGRDPRGQPIVVQYEPPPGLGPAEAGTLVDNSPDNRDLMALLVHCAVRGLVKIRETSAKGWMSRARYAFDLLVPESDWEAKGVSPAERALLRGMFPSTSGAWRREDGAPMEGVVASVRAEDLAGQFHVHLAGIKDAIFAALVREGCYAHRPDHVFVSYLLAAPVAGLAAAGGVTLLNRWWWGVAPEAAIPQAVLTGVATALVVAFFATVMPARTVKGARTREAILGFQEFLARVDAHRLATLPLTPDLFERYLPYAMALGVEGRWAKAFQGICSEPPQWYAGVGPMPDFQAADLTHSLGQMGAATASAMTTAPRSSEGSGFGGGFSDGGGSGGGGFSGGGFGGGGGEGF